MPETLDLLLESSWRGCLLLLFVGAALGAGRFGLRTRHEAWTWSALLFLLLPLSGLWKTEVVLPDPISAGSVEAAQAEGVSSARDDPAGPGAWSRVTYRRPTEDWQMALLVLWSLGAVASALYLGLGLLGLHGWLRDSRPVPAGCVARSWPPSDFSGLEVRISERVSSPVLVGFRRGVVLLPAAAAAWSASMFRALLVHESTHWRNRDPLRLLAVRIAASVFWFHPAIWWLRARLTALAEHRADDAGVDALGRTRYARCLARIALEAAASGRPGPALGSAMASPATLSRRLDRILCSKSPSARNPRWPRRILAATLGLAAAGAVLPVSPVLPAPVEFHRELARLASPSAEERAEALYRLARWPGQESRALPRLVAALGDDAPIDRMPSWSYAEEGWAPARSVWWRASPGEVAALGLASMSGRAAPALERALSSPDPVVRRNAAWALGELRHPRGLSNRAVSRLIRSLEDSAPEVRAAAAWSLGDLGSAEALRAVRARLGAETVRAVRLELSETERALEEGVSREAFRRRADAVDSSTMN